MRPDDVAELNGVLGRRVIPLVDAFRDRQELDGSLTGPDEDDTRLLTRIRDEATAVYLDLGLPHQAEALALDVAGWLEAGLSEPPDFARSRDALRAPAEGELALFLAPVQTTNSTPPVGRRMECFLARRREPVTFHDLGERFPHPKNNCQSMVLHAASKGVREGNCLVFFPENVAARDRVTAQAYAMFFFSKFRKIHETYAIPAAVSVLGCRPGDLRSSGLDPDECYEARATWGYLHDYFHYQGRWPFDQNISLKMNWFVGLLEETKVDAKTILQCAGGGVPHAEQQIDMILLERIFRYPLADDATRNFDSGTGVFLYSWLREHGAIGTDGDHRTFSHAAIIQAVQKYVDVMEDLERRVNSPDEYKAEAKALVRQFLAEDPEGRDRFVFSAEQRVLLRSRAEIDRVPPLTFVPGEL
ncbi:DUF6421 family protein [Nonomuraea rubra]